MHFTTPNPFPLSRVLLPLIVLLDNLEPPTALENEDDAGDKRTVFLAKHRVFDDEDEVEAVSGGGETAFAAIAISPIFFNYYYF